MDDERSKRNFDLWKEGLSLEDLETVLSLVERAMEDELQEEKANPQAKTTEKTGTPDGMADVEIAH